jgi:hypothetical protein
LEDTGVDGRIILKIDLREVDWIVLAQNRDGWRAVVHTIIKFRVT